MFIKILFKFETDLEFPAAIDALLAVKTEHVEVAAGVNIELSPRPYEN